MKCIEVSARWGGGGGGGISSNMISIPVSQGSGTPEGTGTPPGSGTLQTVSFASFTLVAVIITVFFFSY